MGAAEGRVREAATESPLFTDPYAQLFLDEATAQGMSYSLYTDDMMARLQEIDPAITRNISANWSYTASRTRWFDDFFASAGATGVRQAVNLGAGLDARAWRLPWANESVVFEIDQPKVLEFKTATLRSHGAGTGLSLLGSRDRLAPRLAKGVARTWFRPDAADGMVR